MHAENMLRFSEIPHLFQAPWKKQATMPITYTIDHDKRIVFVDPYGLLRKAELLQYQKEVWSRPDIRTYNECVNLDRVTAIHEDTVEDMQELAALAARMDALGQPTKTAIIAGNDYHYGLARMYEAHREILAAGDKQVLAFRSPDEALAWLAAPVSTAAGGTVKRLSVREEKDKIRGKPCNVQ